MTNKSASSEAELPVCFVIMPIADRPGYPPGHFGRVYQIIIEPAVREAGYQPRLASASTDAVVIHLEILSHLLNAPMAICDISDLNANVMYELGVRQAFDKPVVLLKDDRTHNPFDVIPIRHQPYSSSLSYETVVEERNRIKEAIQSTARGSADSVNSLVRLLNLQGAALRQDENDPSAARFQLIEENMSRMSQMMTVIANAAYRSDNVPPAAPHNSMPFAPTIRHMTLYPSEVNHELMSANARRGFSSGLMAEPAQPISNLGMGLAKFGGSDGKISED